MNIYLQSYEAMNILLLLTILFFGTLFVLHMGSKENQREEIEAIKTCNPHRERN